jgi:hypothetical protein
MGARGRTAKSSFESIMGKSIIDNRHQVVMPKVNKLISK